MLSFSWYLVWLTTGYDGLWQHTCIASLDMSAALRQFSLCSVLPLHSSAVTHQATAKISQVKSFDPRSQMEGIRQVRTKDFNHWRSSLSTITVTSRSAARLLGLQLIGHHRVSQPKKTIQIHTKTEELTITISHQIYQEVLINCHLHKKVLLLQCLTLWDLNIFL